MPRGLNARRARVSSSILGFFLVVSACEGGSGGPSAPSPPGQLLFRPAADTILSGTHRFARVEIPEGVTVAVTSDLSLEVAGDVSIIGTLRGACRAISIRTAGLLSARGTIDHQCPDPAFPGPLPALTLVGVAGIRIESGRVRSSGQVTISDRLSLEGSAVGMVPSTSRSGGLRSAQSGGCLVRNADLQASPSRAGRDGPSPNGVAGAGWVVTCRGDLRIEGSTIRAQDGGHGDDVDAAADTGVVVRGGSGGDGGGVELRTAGVLSFGATNTIQAGSGGTGGDAHATGFLGDDTRTNASAEATGGRGGDSGRLRFEGAEGIVNDGTLRLEPGDAGDGGEASAVAGDGTHAVDEPALPGGRAAARGGNGGDVVPVAGLEALEGDVDVQPGRAGNGGEAIAFGGEGGTGSREFPQGANGGDVIARGGDGGENGITDPGDGDGGSVAFVQGVGGDGASMCARPGHTSGLGGSGGDGGTVAGGPGLGGSGGEPGSVHFLGVGNGGDGGDGQPGGRGGDPGIDDTEIPVDAQSFTTEPIFTPGTNGEMCIPPQVIRMSGTIVVAPEGDPAGHDPDLFDAGTGSGGVGSAPGEHIELTITVIGETVFIEGPDPWVPVEGTPGPDGDLVAKGRGSVKGEPNSLVEFRGRFSPTHLTGEYEMQPGARAPIVYTVNVGT